MFDAYYIARRERSHFCSVGESYARDLIDGQFVKGPVEYRSISSQRVHSSCDSKSMMFYGEGLWVYNPWPDIEI